MLNRRVFLSALGLSALAPARALARIVPRKNGLEVHEWGTFTSIASGESSGLEWRPLLGHDDLPLFVYRLPGPGKGDMTGTIRMETPVVYFYAPKKMTAEVSVAFPKGAITEWYPQATLPIDGSKITWNEITIDPDQSGDLPREPSPSHYYPARETASNRVTVGEEHEKFLFYRGVGKFDPELRVDAAGRVSGRGIQHAIAFTRKGDRITIGHTPRLDGEATTFADAKASSVAELTALLESVLVETGLFRDEARAMIETWRDDWFEEGTRLFYLHPSERVEAVLPLHVHPRPERVVRTLVGRVEILTPEFEAKIARLAEQLSDDRTREAASIELAKNRFAHCILKKIDDVQVQIFLATHR